MLQQILNAIKNAAIADPTLALTIIQSIVGALPNAVLVQLLQHINAPAALIDFVTKHPDAVEDIVNTEVGLLKKYPELLQVIEGAFQKQAA